MLTPSDLRALADADDRRADDNAEAAERDTAGADMASEYYRRRAAHRRRLADDTEQGDER